MFSGIVRPLAAADKPAWLSLWAGYLEFYRATLPATVSEATFARLTGPDADMFGLVAEQDGRIVGIAHCIVHPSTWAIEPYVYLNDLFVAPDVRGGGAGRALIEAIYARAGASRVYWLTHESNATARKLYDSLAVNDGFVEYRR
ncbi:MAG TPA: GNAT family N-acetyltransferase [Rhizomicrobium sp.]|nr:GNAT family N-acetyltransferase [Rhizomicrobium sp.]